MKILIVSGFFYPQNTPRAFRTTELAKEFARLGHDVVYISLSRILIILNSRKRIQTFKSVLFLLLEEKLQQEECVIKYGVLLIC